MALNICKKFEYILKYTISKGEKYGITKLKRNF